MRLGCSKTGEPLNVFEFHLDDLRPLRGHRVQIYSPPGLPKVAVEKTENLARCLTCSDAIAGPPCFIMSKFSASPKNRIEILHETLVSMGKTRLAEHYASGAPSSLHRSGHSLP